jgi:hypothetical protein
LFSAAAPLSRASSGGRALQLSVTALMHSKVLAFELNV